MPANTTSLWLNSVCYKEQRDLALATGDVVPSGGCPAVPKHLIMQIRPTGRSPRLAYVAIHGELIMIFMGGRSRPDDLRSSRSKQAGWRTSPR